MGRVDKIGWFADHTPIYTSPPLRLRLLGDTAVEAQPEFTHDWQTVLKRLCARGPGGLGSHASEVQSGLMEE